MPLGKPVSDHTPCVITIESSIPKSKLFRFENFWVNHSGFSEVIHKAWNKHCHVVNSAAVLCKKNEKSEVCSEGLEQMDFEALDTH